MVKVKAYSESSAQKRRLMVTIDYNQVLNAFVDVLPYNKIPKPFTTPTTISNPPGRDDVCAAVVKITADWQNKWALTDDNFEKNKIIEDVEGARELIVRRETEKGVIDETHISLLLSDVVPAYKNGTYQQFFIERQEYIVKQMAKFLEQQRIPVPQVIPLYLSQHKKS